MAIAGKVAITPGGEWSASTAYDKLVVVTYNNDLYLSKKANTGVTPTDTENWQLLIKNVTQEQYDNIINGTTPVGDSDKLGGKGASEYVQTSPTIATNLNTEFGNGFKVCKYSASTLNTPYTEGLTAGRTSGECMTFGLADDLNGIQIAMPAGLKKMFIREVSNGTFGAWGDLATTADLANYLSLSATNTSIVKRSALTPLQVENTNGDGALLGFIGTSGNRGSIGFPFSGVTDPYVLLSDGNYRSLLHTGNKPSGSYTGNGSATQRTINIGGIGYCIAIWSETTQTMAIVTRGGAICKDASGNITTLTNIDLNLLYCDSSIQLILVTNNPVLNENGITYKYAVL